LEAAAILVKSLGLTGGTERFVWGLCNWLNRNQIPFVVYCQKVDVPIIGVRTILLPKRARGRVLKMIELDYFAREMISETQIWSFVRAGNPTVYRSGGGSHRQWVEINGWSVADMVELYLERRILMQSSTIIVNSEMACRDIVRWSKIPANEISVIRNPIDLELFYPTNKIQLPGSPAICFVGNDFVRKGLEIAIQCLAFFPTAQLTVLGSGEQKHFRRLSSSLQVQDRVHFVGCVSTERYLPGADVCLLPTRYDPAANVVGESLACGVPVITTKRNGASEILPAEELIITQRRSLAVWKSAIEWVMSHSDLKDRCRSIAERYNGEHIYRQFWEMARKNSKTY
jgi:UDP-glucose:(heptosyl)LPS alpha-1,3-glucosyltransferase